MPNSPRARGSLPLRLPGGEQLVWSEGCVHRDVVVHARAADDDELGKLGARAIEEGWSVRVLEDRARKSNEEVGLEGQRERDAGQARDAEQEQDLTAMSVARLWGDLLCVEVNVRTLRTQKLRLEVEFTSAEAALALGGHLGEVVARGSKRR